MSVDETTSLGLPWLAVIDMQHIFADPASPWATPKFAEIVEPVRTLVGAFTPRVAFTRFVAPAAPQGAWVGYYRRWPFALQRPDSHDYALVDAFNGEQGAHIEATTFHKWTPAMAATIPTGSRLFMAGVTTDCCVLSTALAAADAGVGVVVVADGCAGVDDTSHEAALAVLRGYMPLVDVVTVAEALAILSARESG